MLYLYSNPKPKKVIRDVEIRFKSLISNHITFDADIYHQIIKIIDHVTAIHGNSIETPFGSASVLELSSGCKAVLLAIYYANIKDTNWIVSIEECGSTPIKVLCKLAEKRDIAVYFASQVSVFSNSVECVIDGVKCKGNTEIYNRTLEISTKNKLAEKETG